MLIKELKEVIKDFPDDADILIQKRITGKQTIVAPVLKIRTSKTETGKSRLILINDKEIIIK